MAIHRHQAGTVELTAKERFYREVIHGLSSTPKYLPSKYFYDAAGDRLFQQIMQLPEYYLTRCEHEIFVKQTKALAAPLLQQFETFDVLELGAGDATKSTHLLRYLNDSAKDFTYYPIDISENVIRLLENEMPQRIPGLEVHGLNGDYFDMLAKSYDLSNRNKLVLFLGSNIGNFKRDEAERFLQALNYHLQPGDMVLIGFDVKKNPKDILAAYNDDSGVTKAFNLNLLKRINCELGADFNLTKFDHYPTYNPISGACKSYLISLQNQQVTIGEESFSFYKNEPVWTELSQKYAEREIDELAMRAGFKPIAKYYDSKDWFVDVLWERI
ncbi:L-histidine N(alpha)-methyltransferase [Ilyomonas limi]|uniref:L-histidine N(Alpha)-methyltransferase n=1 Tax=Ilyomonas limi TaxID=2575867 RepID=A0A4U3KYV8_9BACT|nr:L-histidine N(alpha)-methyltransferase [Ilyomonas limi]TKK66974.1 L-histidine N(alpha)-methyltransferase [Ilyomonas limi]